MVVLRKQDMATRFLREDLRRPQMPSDFPGAVSQQYDAGDITPMQQQTPMEGGKYQDEAARMQQEAIDNNRQIFDELMGMYGQQGLTASDAASAIISGRQRADENQNASYQNVSNARAGGVGRERAESGPTISDAARYQDDIRLFAGDFMESSLRAREDNDLYARAQAGQLNSQEEYARAASLMQRMQGQQLGDALGSGAGDRLSEGMQDFFGSTGDRTYGGNHALQALDFIGSNIANAPGGMASVFPSAGATFKDLERGTQIRDGEFVPMTGNQAYERALSTGLDIASMMPVAGVAGRTVNAVRNAAQGGVRGAIATGAREGVRAGLGEAPIEGLQGALDEHATTGQITPENVFQSAAGGFIGGLGLGGVVAGVGQGITNVRSKPNTVNEQQHMNLNARAMNPEQSPLGLTAPTGNQNIQNVVDGGAGMAPPVGLTSPTGNVRINDVVAQRGSDTGISIKPERKRVDASSIATPEPVSNIAPMAAAAPSPMGAPVNPLQAPPAPGVAPAPLAAPAANTDPISASPAPVANPVAQMAQSVQTPQNVTPAPSVAPQTVGQQMPTTNTPMAPAAPQGSPVIGAVPESTVGQDAIADTLEQRYPQGAVSQSQTNQTDSGTQAPAPTGQPVEGVTEPARRTRSNRAANKQPSVKNDTTYTRTARRMASGNVEVDRVLASSTKVDGVDLGRKRKTKKIKDMRSAANSRYKTMSQKELKQTWLRDSTESSQVASEEAVINAGTAYMRAIQLKDYDTATSIYEHIANGIVIRGTSGSGLAMRALAEFTWNTATPQMKRDATRKIIDRSRKDAGMGSLSSEQEARLYASLDETFAYEETVTDLTNEALERIAAMENAETANSIQETKILVNQIASAQVDAGLAVSRSNNIIADLMPKTEMGKKVGNFMRASMLSNPFGRLRDIVQTQGAAAVMTADTAVTAMLNRAIEGVTGKKLGLPSHVFAQASVGQRQGVKRARGAARGRVTSQALFGTERGRSEINASNVVTRAIAGSTEIATHLVEGLTTSRAYSLAHARNAQLGYKGDTLTVKSMLDAITDETILKDARQYGARASFLQDNAVTNTFRMMAEGMNKIPHIGPVIRNLTIPFTNVAGGLIHEGITKRNLVANVAGMIRAGVKGDLNAFTENFGRAVVNGGLLAAGWALVSAGLITTEDANGDDYEGLYLHLGDQYIPIGALPGQIGMAMLIGSIAGSYVNGDDSQLENWFSLVKIMSSMSDLSLGSSPVIGGIMDVAQGGGEGAIVKTLSAIVSPFIPAAFTALNAMTDTVTQVFFGPDQAIQTRVTEINPATGREVTEPIQTEINRLQSRLPGLRELLPRTDERTSRSALDVFTTGSHSRAGDQPAANGGSTEMVDNAEKPEDHYWYNIITDAETGEQRIRRTDGVEAAYSGDISGAGLTATDLKYLSMTASEIERDEESDRWEYLQDFYAAQTKAIRNELDNAREDYDAGTRSLQDIAAIEKRLTASEDNGIISGVNVDVRDNQPQLLAAAGVDSVYELGNLYNATSLTEWRELAETNPEMFAALAQYDQMRTDKKVSDKEGDKLNNKYYQKEAKPSNGRPGGGGGGSSRYKLPSVEDLTMKQFFAKGNKTSQTLTTNRKSVAPINLDPGKSPEKIAGKGIKTTPRNFTGASTIVYNRAKTRQPAMGSPMDDFLRSQSPQDSFTARRTS